MKKILLLLLVTLSTNSFSQEKKLDEKLFGSWSGTEKDNQRVGLTKNWIMHRFEDGRFVLLFTMVEDGEVTNFTESGRCWTEGNTFYEFHNNSGETDVYTYQILNDSQVKFKAKSLKSEHANQEYEFIDTKLEEVDL